jgi:sorbose reductase
MDVNLKGMFFVNQSVARQMIKQRSGRIINIASMSSVIINQNSYGSSGVYCISKAGVVNLTKAFASDLAPFGVTVNAISPGYMRTPLSASFWADPVGSEQKCSRIPMGRPGSPEELAGIVVYLASDLSTYTTGANILVDGGYTIW